MIITILQITERLTTSIARHVDYEKLMKSRAKMLDSDQSKTIVLENTKKRATGLIISTERPKSCGKTTKHFGFSKAFLALFYAVSNTT